MGNTVNPLSHVPAHTMELANLEVFLHFDDLDDQLRIILSTNLSSELTAVSGALRITNNMLAGKKKSDPNAMNEYIAFFRDQVKYKELLPENYLFFGSGNNKANLEHFLRTNSFFTAALGCRPDPASPDRRQFTVTSYDENSSSTNWYTRCLRTYQADFPRVNVVLDESLTLLSYSVYVNDNLVSGFSEAEAMAILGVTLTFFAEVQHAILHVFNLIMVTSLLHSTQYDSFLRTWSKPFASNIFQKYLEVATLLLNKSGVLTTSAFKSTYHDLDNFARELLVCWLSFRTANDLIRGYFLSGITSAVTTGGTPGASTHHVWTLSAAHAEIERLLAPEHTTVLSEWRKHAALATPYARDLAAVFRKKNPDSLDHADRLLAQYLSRPDNGFTSPVCSVQDWLEVMSVFGVMHGNTLSMTRWILSHSILSQLSPYEKTFTKQDVSTVGLGTATILGLQHGRHVYSSEVPDTDLHYPPLHFTLQKYDALTGALKMAYHEWLWSQPDVFVEFGWILSDFGMDGVDNKQLTMTTYV